MKGNEDATKLKKILFFNLVFFRFLFCIAIVCQFSFFFKTMLGEVAILARLTKSGTDLSCRRCQRLSGVCTVTLDASF